MIRYALTCEKDHEFEAWFRSSADYDRSVAVGEATCPFCNTTSVEKAIMAPSLSRTDVKSGTELQEKKQFVAAPDPKQEALRQAIRELRDKVTENADYVGDRFAEEARKMHYNEIEHRGIYGEATGEQAQSLAEEGIDFAPLPPLPEDGN